MKNSGVPLSAFPAHVQAQVRAQLAGKPPGAEVDVVVKLGPLPPFGSHPLHEAHNDTEAGGPAIRQRKGQALNKTEQAFDDHLIASGLKREEVKVQEVTLVLGNGVRYTPDFFVPGVLTFYEVKGFMRDDAAVKVKVAATLHRWAKFYLVSRKGRAHPWRIRQVLPL